LKHKEGMNIMKNIDIASIQKRRYETYEKEKDNLIVIKVDGGYQVSNLGKASTYTVTKDADGVITCTCKDYHNYKGAIRCKHIIAVGKKATKASNSYIKSENHNINKVKEEINMNFNENNLPVNQDDIKTLQAILTRPFPVELIKYRKGFNNKQLAYVETVHYINRLNEAFNYQWDWQIINYTVTDDQVYCQGRLSVVINGKLINKESFGGKDITMVDVYDKVTRKATGRKALSIADDLKSASSDALKKAASLLGIGLHLYISQQKPSYPSTSNIKPGEVKIDVTTHTNASSTPAKPSTVAPVQTTDNSGLNKPGGNGKGGNGKNGNGKTDINQIIKRW